MDDRRRDLSNYRLKEADDSLKVDKHCLDEELYKDSINRSYYAAFYAVKAVLALSTVDFKRHKDVMGYFNKCSKNSLTSIDDGMNCTSEHICSNNSQNTCSYMTNIL